MQGVLEGCIPLNERFRAHIDLCLGCRACESACPNHVAYGDLLVGMRRVMAASRRHGLRQRLARAVLVDGVITKPRVLRLASSLVRFWQGSGLKSLGQKITRIRHSRLGRFALQLPTLKAQPVWQAIYPAVGRERGRVGLFLGCVARAADSETLAASIFVLNRLGYAVLVPPAQACCGALHLSQGELEKAREFEQKNLEAFAGLDLDAVISTATGCGAALKDYPPEFAGKLKDVSEFIDGVGGWEGIEIAPLPEKLAVHEPCLMRNVLHCERAPYSLLRHIPGAKVVPLAGNDQCCGAAGTYFLSQPEMADALLADKIENVKEEMPRYLLSSNIGCAMHMAAGLGSAGVNVEVLHPVTLLARQMGFDYEKTR